MISYFTNGKGKLEHCEDSFTASVFDLLKYLPTDLFWGILKDSLLLDNLPVHCGEILEMEYWAKWSAKNTSNQNFIEPDLFIRFKEFDLVIEAKRYDYNQQSDHQLENELKSYFNVYAEDNKKVFIMQLGGLHLDCTKESHEILGVKIFQSKTTWSKLLDSIDSKKKRIEKQMLPYQKPMLFIFEDLMSAFAIHGFHKKKWLAKMPPIIINKIDFKNFKKHKNVK